MPKTATSTNKIKVVFFGSSETSALFLEDLLASSQYQVVAVITQATRIHGHQSTRVSAVARLTESRDITLFTPTKLAEITRDLQKLQPRVGVLFAYGKILPNETINLFPAGIVNIHPSLLPKHRGPSPLESTILAGDTVAGTSIMLIAQEMDAGPILDQSQFTIAGDISKQALWQQLIAVSRKLLIPTLNKYLDGKITPRPQPKHVTPSYSRIIKKLDGDVDLNVANALELERTIRAYAGWPGTRIPIIWRGENTSLTIHQARLVSKNANNQANLACTNKTLILNLPKGSLELTQVQLPGRKIITGKDFCNAGYFSLNPKL
jgi:methionyl-tRNA formyltransferase